MVEHSTENAGVAGSIPALGARAARNSPSGSSSAVEHFLAKEEVAGSNPVSRPTHRRRLHSRGCRGVAQLVARVVRDDEVAGSSPVTPTTIHPAKRIRTRPPPHFALHRPPHSPRTSSLRLRGCDYHTVFVHRSLGTTVSPQSTAPARRSASAVSIWPLYSAKCSDVRPCSALMSTSAPADTRANTISV